MDTAAACHFAHLAFCQRRGIYADSGSAVGNRLFIEHFYCDEFAPKTGNPACRAVWPGFFMSAKKQILASWQNKTHAQKLKNAL